MKFKNPLDGFLFFKILKREVVSTFLFSTVEFLFFPILWISDRIRCIGGVNPEIVYACSVSVKK